MMNCFRWNTVIMLAAVFALAFSVGAVLADDAELRKEALRLNDIVGEDPIKKQIEALKNKPDHTKKLLAVAVGIAKEKDQPFTYNGAYILGMAASEQKEVEAGTLFFRICIEKAQMLKSDSKLANAYLELIDLLSANKKYEAVEKICKEVLEVRGGSEINRAKASVLRRLIQVTALQGKAEQAAKLLEPFLKAAPDDPVIMEIQAWLFRHEGKYEESAKVYEKILDAVERDEAKDLVRYLLSNLYSEAGNIDKATEHLQELIKKKPDNPSYNNDLGYIWADSDRNLDEAEKMVKKALDQSPKNSAYLDSMGWVLFKRKKFKEAKEYIQRAVENPDGQHAEVYDHLGEIHKVLDEKADAVKAWKKAIEVAGKSKREQIRKEAIEKKIKDNQ